MLIMLIVWKSFTKPSEKLNYRTYIFWNIFLLCCLFKILTTTLVDLVTLKVHDLSKDFNKTVVVTIKSIL